MAFCKLILSGCHIMLMPGTCRIMPLVGLLHYGGKRGCLSANHTLLPDSHLHALVLLVTMFMIVGSSFSMSGVIW